MPRIARTRSRILRASGVGSVVKTIFGSFLSSSSVGPYQMGQEAVSDFVGAPWTDSTFYLERGISPSVLFNGVYPAGFIVNTLVDVPLEQGASELMSKPWIHFPMNPLTPTTLANMARANMNPNRPAIDLPVSLVELREIPKLLKDLTELLAIAQRGARDAARANLAGQFGVLPIIRDVMTLFDFAKEVDKKEKYLRELSRGDKRISRSLHKEEWSTSSSSVVILSPTAGVPTGPSSGYVTCEASREYWFTARAHLLNPPPERELRSLSAEITLGTDTVHIEQLYALTPWSWLIDWFSDTGTILAAYRGGLEWDYGDLNVMYRTKYHTKLYAPNLPVTISMVPGRPQAKAVQKERIQPFTGSVLPSWRIPYLDGRQWSILSSLAILGPMRSGNLTL